MCQTKCWVKRNFFCQSDIAQYNDLLVHNDIRWLIKRKPLKRLCGLRGEILAFLCYSKQQKANNFLSLMENGTFSTAVYFLRNVSITWTSSTQSCRAGIKQSCNFRRDFMHFKESSLFYSADPCPGKMLHFSTLHKSQAGLQITDCDDGIYRWIENQCCH